MKLSWMAGAGWGVRSTRNYCTRSNALAGGASYPPITATVDVAADATSPQVNAVGLGRRLGDRQRHGFDDHHR